MKQLTTQGIILRRTNYGEADRIISVITPDSGKLSFVVRGVRKAKSKLAGGIELFSVSDLVYMQGRGDLHTLISARLTKHYGNITKDLPRVQLGYDLIALLNKSTEDETEPEYYHLLEASFRALDDLSINLDLVRLWFESQLLHINGHTPNLHTDTSGEPLDATKQYNFDVENMAFNAHSAGRYKAGDIKVLRLLFSSHDLAVISKVQGLDALLPELSQLVRTLTHA